MVSKKLQAGSKYNEYDLDGDGIVSDDELTKSKEMLELELREEKAQKDERFLNHRFSQKIMRVIQ